MNIKWEITQKDVKIIEELFRSHKNRPFVERRINRNVKKEISHINIQTVWKKLVTCLLTTQQRVGKGSKVREFLTTKPFPLDYQKCNLQKNLKIYAQKTIQNSGLRRYNNLSKEIEYNFNLLSNKTNGIWNELKLTINKLSDDTSIEDERNAANYINDTFKGFGPKQSRNLLQTLGLSIYEIPLDSRVIKWFNDFGFPVQISAKSLSDRYYYQFISDGIQQLCKKSNVYPCVLDAIIFDTFYEG